MIFRDRNETEQATVFSQQLLAIANERNAEQKEAARLYDEARRSILFLHASGAEVEPGPLRCEVTIRKEKRVTFKRLAEVHGREKAEELRRSLPVNDVKILWIFSTPKSGRGPGISKLIHKSPRGPR